MRRSEALRPHLCKCVPQSGGSLVRKHRFRSPPRPQACKEPRMDRPGRIDCLYAHYTGRPPREQALCSYIPDRAPAVDGRMGSRVRTIRGCGCWLASRSSTTPCSGETTSRVIPKNPHQLGKGGEPLRFSSNTHPYVSANAGGHPARRGVLTTTANVKAASCAAHPESGVKAARSR
jgi:hypothetical protein